MVHSASITRDVLVNQHHVLTHNVFNPHHMKTVGERIRQAREFRGLSGETLANEVGYKTQSGISNLENRSVGRGGFNLPKIAKALNFSIDWFLNGPDVDDMSRVPPFGSTSMSLVVEEPQGQYLTSRQHAHHLLDQLSDLGVDKAITMLEVIAAAHPRSQENGAGVSLPAPVKKASRRP